MPAMSNPIGGRVVTEAPGAAERTEGREGKYGKRSELWRSEVMKKNLASTVTLGARSSARGSFSSRSDQRPRPSSDSRTAR